MTTIDHARRAAASDRAPHPLRRPARPSTPSQLSGVAEVAAGHQRADQRAGPGQHQPVDGRCGSSRSRRTCSARQVTYAVAPRIAATKNSASGWSQVTTGAVPRPARRAGAAASRRPGRRPPSRDQRPADGGPQPALGRSARPAASSGGSSASLELERQVVAARRRRSGRPASSSSATGPTSGSSASGSRSCHGRSTKARSCGARVRQPERRRRRCGGRRPRSGRRRGCAARCAPRCARARRRPRWPARGRAAVWRRAWCRCSTTALRKCFESVGRVDRLGLVDRGDGGDPDVGGVGDARRRAPCRLAIRSPRLEPSASTARRIGRISPVSVSASTMCGLGVSVTAALASSG